MVTRVRCSNQKWHQNSWWFWFHQVSTRLIISWIDSKKCFKCNSILRTWSQLGLDLFERFASQRVTNGWFLLRAAAAKHSLVMVSQSNSTFCLAIREPNDVPKCGLCTQTNEPFRFGPHTCRRWYLRYSSSVCFEISLGNSAQSNTSHQVSSEKLR